MNPELLSCRRLTAGFIYPPLQLKSPDLNRLYAEITERYPYQTLQHLPDGIRMANANGDCFIQIGRTQINENVMYYQAGREKCLDIFQIVRGKYDIRQILTFGSKLTAFLPLDNADAASSFMESNIFSVPETSWSILGAGRKGAGLRVILHQDGIYDLRIEPFYKDTTELYIELDVQHPHPVTDIDLIEAKMDAAYNFLFSNVKDFLKDVCRNTSK